MAQTQTQTQTTQHNTQPHPTPSNCRTVDAPLCTRGALHRGFHDFGAFHVQMGVLLSEALLSDEKPLVLGAVLCLLPFRLHAHTTSARKPRPHQNRDFAEHTRGHYSHNGRRMLSLCERIPPITPNPSRKHMKMRYRTHHCVFGVFFPKTR